MERLYWHWFCSCQCIGVGKKHKLLGHLGGVQQVYKCKSKKALMHLGGLTIEQADKLISDRNRWSLEGEYEKLCRLGISFIPAVDSIFPQKLKYIEDRPLGLYIKGTLPDQNRLSVGIVGARRCSGYGRAIADEAGRALGAAGVQVISGLALGIDSISQAGALSLNGSSYGIMGCGVDICYPRSNIELYMKIQQKGGLISEYPPGTAPAAFHFPLRNRIISGLSDAVLVIEAKEKSGSLITADYALEQGKDVYAVPGRVTDGLSQGCNQLIRQGGGLFLSVNDFMEELGIKTLVSNKKSKKENLSLAQEEILLYSCLDFKPKNLQEILSRTGLSAEKATAILLEMELKGYVIEYTKNYYAKNKGI